MRINIYNTELNEDLNTVLVKEKSINYKEAESYYLNNPNSIVEVMNNVFLLNKKSEEYVLMIALNTKNKPLGFFLISKGTVNSSLISPREILIRGLLSGATNFILVHNHPSLEVTPSSEDKRATSRIKEASDLIGLTFLDHIIIGGDSYFSFKEKDLL